MRLGLELGGTNFKLGLINEEAIVERIQVLKSDEFFSAKNLLKSLEKKVDLFLGNRKVTRVGISAKGIVDVEKGMIVDDVGEAKFFSNILLRDFFSKKFNVPSNIDNDARCYALGEWKFGDWGDSKNLTCITLGTGVGCASILNGELFYGSDHLGGVLGGHISINRNGPQCPCGNIGCLEMFCSKNGLSRIFKKSNSRFANHKDPVKSFFSHISEKKLTENKIFNDFINNLSIGLTNIIHAYSPDILILGGGIMNSSEIILPKLKKKVDKMAFTYPKGRCKIFSSKLGNHAPLLGATFHPNLEN